MRDTKTTQSLNEIFGVGTTPEVVDAEPNYPSAEYPSAEYPIEPVDAPNLPALSENDPRTAEERLEDEDFKDKASEDYELARSNYHELLTKGENLLDLAIEIAESTQEPKAIDSAAKLLTNMMTANSKLLEITKAKQEVFMRTRAKEVLKTAFADGGNTTTTNINPQTINNNNTLFVGSPSDLNKMLREIKAEKEENQQ